MKLRTKLALAFSAAILLAVAVASGVFLWIEYAGLDRARAESQNEMRSGVLDLISEANLAGDPLMLVDYLRVIGHEHKKIRRERVWLNGRWQDVAGGKKNFREKDALVMNISPPHGGGLKAQIWFSQKALAREREKARELISRDMLRTAAVAALIGIVMSLPLSWGFSRRLSLINSVAKSIGEGKASARLPDLGGDEIGTLAHGLNAMAEKLEDLDRMKKEFSASVTHELRSPLAAIESYVSQILKSASLREEDRQGLTRILRNAERLSHFVGNLLQMAKIERGKLDFFPKPANLSEIAEDSALFFRPNASELNISLETQIDKNIPLLRLDPDLISHVVTNFISNALKFTRPGGKIVVGTKRVGDFAECWVLDSGVGIGEKDLKRLFSPFERIRNPLKATGVGLGLAISKSIIETHGGVIGADSKLNVGSRFYFRLPMKSERS